MAEYTVVKVSDVPDQAENLGIDPEKFEIRFLRNDLELRALRSQLRALQQGVRGRRAHAQPAGGDLPPGLRQRAGARRRQRGDRPRAVDGGPCSARDPTCAPRRRRRGRDLRQGRRAEHRAGRRPGSPGQLRLACLTTPSLLPDTASVGADGVVSIGGLRDDGAGRGVRDAAARVLRGDAHRACPRLPRGRAGRTRPLQRQGVPERPAPPPLRGAGARRRRLDARRARVRPSRRDRRRADRRPRQQQERRGARRGGGGRRGVRRARRAGRARARAGCGRQPDAAARDARDRRRDARCDQDGPPRLEVRPAAGPGARGPPRRRTSSAPRSPGSTSTSAHSSSRRPAPG